MKDQTELAPCPPKCPICGHAMATRHRNPDDLYSKWYCVDRTGCVLAYRDISREILNSRPDLRRIKELEELANGLSDTANASGSRIKELEEKVKELERLKIYVWDQFNPDWSDGLAFALAESEDKAREAIIEKMGFPPSDWGGSPTVFDTVNPAAFAVSGGG